MRTMTAAAAYFIRLARHFRRAGLVTLVGVGLALPAAQASAAPGAASLATAAAQSAANPYAASAVPAERFVVGNLAVERHGSGGVPLILVPGLGGGAWVWQDTIARFKDRHSIYVVTLPGFDGRPAAGGAAFAQARASLAQLIASRHLDRPVIIGHSLGATLALAVAEDGAALRGVVAIDGLAVMPGTEHTPPAMRAQMAAAIKARMDGAGSDPLQFAQQQQQYMRGIGVTDLAMADQLAQLQARSAPAAVSAIMAEVLEQDLRPGLPKISVPVLLVAPYFAPDGVQRGLSEAMVKAYYGTLMTGTAQLTVRTIAPSRHFVMFDQPQALGEAVQAFIAPL